MTAPLLDHASIAAMIPHSGSMCLLESVEQWDSARIVCSAVSHRDPANPLRLQGTLWACNGIEYAAQAMALHGSFNAAPGSTPTPGFLASVRGVRLLVPRLDTLAEDLLIQVTKLAGDHQQALYAFTLHGESGTLLVDGRATVILSARS